MADTFDRVTMREVALAADVSVSTVSHVVNGTRAVAAETRERVQQAMRALGYEHQPTARSLAAGGNRTIGLAITVANNPYWVDLIQGIDGEATRAGLSLVIVDTRDDARYESSSVANLLAHRLEGLIISPAADWRGTTLPLLRDQGLPFVMVDRIDPALHVDQVGVENEAATIAVIDHLIRHGHRRIGMLSGIPGLSTSAERLRGYHLAHERAGLRVDPDLVRVGDSSSPGGRRATSELLQLGEPPTAMFTGNSGMTIGALAALHAAGVGVPDDMALVAFDDFPWADLFSPALTTIAQPSAAIGARAVQLLVRRMQDPDAPAQTMRLPVEIMHRESCGCVR
ncbi:LacI family DNA-binding transcriptional regulator [Kribbella sandramycini]|uniref:LacI family DNA-binding transcriptional regulator n=1 Tax=Kribbella sandramycini TaxID=60450 RepID=A0A7Y4KX98_9ACTN|nr:LacI family DNA-binding transcriptional regulator [Kribbella sandramycini]MBB6569861.1 LacI family transcriptional regulator [Kribbella sandramycini]NOL40314.1 LacI family DNA-binding transcriptional regulator [Kribbella sandramycini]